jgi:hypothetical protein
MSKTNILKAELKAHRSSRELEHSLDHLGIQVHKGAMKADELKARANVVVTQIKNPKDTLYKIVNARIQNLLFSVRTNRKYIASVQFLRDLTPVTKPILIGVGVVGAAVATYLLARKPRPGGVSTVQVEQLRKNFENKRAAA